ncbi:Two-component system response regulator [Marinobacter nitratireducens]|uniref:Two-component system response regulator n=1 Tax=Marinobacter nitratireducens TaxID=1137280 RepID=A0A072MZT0_9GAMM|nr:response regulator [Marinobacter nitratireducens]KEF30188.1 Two-component system response regulator [Marinobacter nitratireducens]
MRVVPILMADDDPLDQLLTKEAFQEAKSLNPIYFVSNGVELMQYLRREPPYNDETAYPWPGLVLLDLNMPKMGGRECLEQIRKDPELQHLPVVIMTTSNREEEIFKSYDLGANSYITKPVDFEKLVAQVGALSAYWCSIVELPDV